MPAFSGSLVAMVRRAVQKAYMESGVVQAGWAGKGGNDGCRQHPVEISEPCVDSLWKAVFCCKILGMAATPGEIGLAPAPKEQPPRKLSGKRTAWLDEIWKEASNRKEWRPPTG